MSAATNTSPRRAGALVLVLCAAIVAIGAGVQSSAAAGASAKPVTPAKPVKTQTAIRRTSVPAPGTYTIIVSLSGPKTTETVDVFAGSQSQRGISVTPQGNKLLFSQRVSGRAFNVRVASHGPKVPFTVATAAQAAPSPTPPVVVPSGSTSPTGPVAGPYNTLRWSDEFNGLVGTPPNPLAWTPDSGGGCGDGTLSTNTTDPANAQQDGSGNLAINAMGSASTPPYSTAQLDTDGLFSFTYGRIEARIDIPAGRGLCSAFWLLADDGEELGWPNGGEIDVLEAIGNLPNQVDGFLHGPISQVYNDQQWASAVNSVTPMAGGFHTYGLIWKPNSLTWTVDGVPVATATPSRLPKTARWVYNSHPFHIVLDEAVGGWPGNPDGATVFPATMRVDWVRVYQ